MYRSDVLLNISGLSSQAAEVGVKWKGYLTDLPTLLVQLAAITPLRLLLQGLREQKSYQDLKAPPLYDFYSTDTPPGKPSLFQAQFLWMCPNSISMNH